MFSEIMFYRSSSNTGLIHKRSNWQAC
uniref:Uncharacterized protein n=1 Tax=Arundo donax TaxID=35708 RepID=A0A0A8XNA6_ARUDO